MTKPMPLTIERNIANSFRAADLKLNLLTTAVAKGMHKSPLGSDRMAMYDRIYSHMLPDAQAVVKRNLIALAHGVEI